MASNRAPAPVCCTAGEAVGLRNALPIPPITWCRICQRRPVAAAGPFSGRCARCRAVAHVGKDLR